LIVLSVLRGELRKIVWQFADGIHGRRLADRNASAAVNASNRVYEKLGSLCEPGLIFARMNAVDWANLNTFLVFGTSSRNDVGHMSLHLKSTTRARKRRNSVAKLLYVFR